MIAPARTCHPQSVLEGLAKVVPGDAGLAGDVLETRRSEFPILDDHGARDAGHADCRVTAFAPSGKEFAT